MNIARLNELHSEHWRLIHEAMQTPPVALLIRMRLLRIIRDEFPDDRMWLAYGSRPAEEILDTAADSVLCLDGAQFTELLALLKYAEQQPVRPGTDSVDWSSRVLGTIAELERLYLSGSRPPGGTSDWIGVPVIYELLGQPAMPDYADLRAAGVQWLYLELEHVTRLSREFGDHVSSSPAGTGSSPSPDASGPHRQESAGTDRELPRVRGRVDDETARYLSRILERLDELVPEGTATGAAPLDHLGVCIRTVPDIRLRGSSAGLPFLLQLLHARHNARPVRRSLAWMECVAATGVLNGHRFEGVGRLEEKLLACERAGVGVVFVPAVQEETARRIQQDRRLSLIVEGMANTEGTRRLLRPDGKWVHERLRTVSQQLRQSWFWYLRSAFRAAMVTVAGLLLIAALVAVFWPVPSRCEWPEDGKLTFRNWIGLPVAHPRVGNWPGALSQNGIRDGLYCAILPRSGGWLPMVAVVSGTAKGEHDVLTLLDWRGRTIETWNASDDPALPATGDRNFAWAPFHLRKTHEDRDLLLTPYRSIGGNLTVVRVFEKTRRGLERRAFAWNRGHLEWFPERDVNGDGRPDQLALGWSQFLTADGTERSDLHPPERGRCVAYVIDLGDLADGTWKGGPFTDVPSLTEPGAEAFGLAIGWSFPLDGFMPVASSTCNNVRMVRRGVAEFCCFGASSEAVSLYEVHTDETWRTDLAGVAINDAYRDILRERGWEADSIATVLDSLSTQVLWRGARWERLKRLERGE